MFDLLHGAATDALHDVDLRLRGGSAVTVVLASEGYPTSPKKGRLLGGLAELSASANYGTAWVNYAGVSVGEGGDFIASGGRVLSCTALGENLEATQKMAYELLSNIDLEGGHFRRDIGHRAIQ